MFLTRDKGIVYGLPFNVKVFLDFLWFFVEISTGQRFPVEELLLALCGVAGFVVFAECHGGGIGELFEGFGKVALIFKAGKRGDFPKA